jgi:hypothetical protein
MSTAFWTPLSGAAALREFETPETRENLTSLPLGFDWNGRRCERVAWVTIFTFGPTEAHRRMVSSSERFP